MKKILIIMCLALTTYNAFADQEDKRLELQSEVNIPKNSEIYIDGKIVQNLYKSECYIRMANTNRGEDLKLAKGTIFNIIKINKRVVETEWFFYPKLEIELQLENSEAKLNTEIVCNTKSHFILESTAEKHYVSIREALKSVKESFIQID